MNTDQIRAASAGLFFVFIFISGFWLSHSGKPLNAIILTIHKLISVGALVYLAVTVYQINQAARLNPLQLILVIASAVFFLGLIATGGLLSAGKVMPAIVLALHRVIPYLTVLSTGSALFLLLTRRI